MLISQAFGFFICRKDDTEEDVLVNEQIANVFALLVLLPKQAFTTARALLVDFSMLAEYFDVDKQTESEEVNE